MHTKPMSESEGEFAGLKEIEWSELPCKGCGGTIYFEQLWTSSCGGYDDYKYTCKGCGRMHWVEGADS